MHLIVIVDSNFFLQGDAADQNAFQSKGANATLKSCEKEIWLTSPQIKVPEKFNDPEAQQQEMNKNIQGKIFHNLQQHISQKIKHLSHNLYFTLT